MLDKLTLDQLRILVAVAQAGTFSSAARHLSRVQSAISQSIKGLERDLRLNLFDRSSKRPTLTPEGRAIVEEAVALLRGVERLRARAKDMSGDVEPSLSLVVEQMLPSSIVMDTLRKFNAQFPNLPVTLLTESLGAPEQRLRDLITQFAIYSPYTDSPSDVETEYFSHVSVVPVVSTTHELAKVRGSISRDVLDSHIQLILTDRARQVSSVVQGAHFGTQVWRFGDQSARLEYLLQGFGWSYLPAHLAEDMVLQRKLTVLDLKIHQGRYLTLPLVVGFRRSDPPGIAGRWFIGELHKRFAKLERSLRVLSRMKGSINSRMLPATSS